MKSDSAEEVIVDQKSLFSDFFVTTRRQLFKIIAGAAGSLLGGFRLGSAQSSQTQASKIDWAKLQSKVKGTLVSRGSADYETTRQSMMWNAFKVERFPDAIVRVASEADVREAVRFAREHGLRVAVRGGGHNWNATSVRRGGLLIDLSQLNEVRVDAAKQKAIAGPTVGALDFAKTLAAKELAFPVGHCPDVPLSGYLLNGGFGWNSNTWGPACFSLEGIQLVDATGESIYADQNKNADYFWAARGAGPGFFGVVTQYHLKVHPLPHAILTSTLIYKLEDMESVAAKLPALIASLPPQVEIICLLVSAPPDPQTGKQDPKRRAFVISAAAFADTASDARKWLEPVETQLSIATPIQKDLYRETPFDGLFNAVGALFPQNRRYAADIVLSNATASELLSSVREQMLAAPSAESFVLMALPSPPPKNAPPLPDMAFSVFASAFVGIYDLWEDPAQDKVNQEWMRGVQKQMNPLKVALYVGESDLTTPDRPAQCFSQAAWKKLQVLKKKYDPDNLFYSYLGEAG